MKPYHRNPRSISKKRAARLADTLKRLGDLGGIIHNLATDEIIGGNQRSRVFGEATKVEIVEHYDQPDTQGTVAHGFIVWKGSKFAYRQVQWDEDTAAEANIAANIGAGEWDADILANQWDADLLKRAGMDNELLDQMNREAAMMKAMLTAADAGASDVDAEPQIDKADELREKWQTARGQVWQLDDHRLMCGDSTSAEDVARLMGGELAVLVVTDPPYGVAYADKNTFLNEIGKANSVQTEIANDHATKEETQEMWRAAFEQMNKVMQAGAVVYCFMPQGGDQMMMMMMMMMMGAGIEPRHELIWLKNNHVLGRVDYAYKHEPILYAWKAGGHKYYGGFQTSVVECKKPQKSDLHPTMKPVELIAKLIGNSSQKQEIVYEPFSGSGTTIIACEQLGRKARAMEISPAYIAVALERWATATGKTPVLIEP